MKLERINALIAPEMLAVDNIIQTHLVSDVELVKAICTHIIRSGGKRLRPMVLLLCAKSLGFAGSCHHYLAAVVELIHTATLLHDDVIDESELRRGQKTANEEYGNAASVLVGDFLYSQGFNLTMNIKNEHIVPVLKVLSKAAVLIAEGEVRQLMNCHNPDLEEKDYMQVINYKTAKLFEASAQVSAVICQASPETEKNMANYGRHLGIAFQLVDDVLDYSGTEIETGKHLGDDLAEGKLTLPLIYVIRHGNKAQKDCVRQAIIQGGREDFVNVLAAIKETNALDYVRKLAEQETDLAKKALESVPNSTYKDALLDLADFAINRSF